MQCPECGAWTRVCETREAPLRALKRTRECANGHRFATMEIYAAVLSPARARMRTYAATCARRAKLWARDRAINKAMAAGTSWQDIAAKYGLRKSAVFLARKRGGRENPSRQAPSGKPE